MTKGKKNGLKRITALLICIVLCMGMLSACVGTSAKTTAIVVSQQATNVSYEIGDHLDYDGLKVQAKLENGFYKELSENKYTIDSDFNSAKVGDYTVTIVYKSNENIKTDYKVRVNETTAMSLVITNPPTKQVYEIGDSIDYSGLKLQKSVSTSVVVDADINECYISTDFDSSKPGIYQITIFLKEDSSKKATFSVTVNEAHIAKIKLTTDEVKKTYAVGEDLDFTALGVTQVMSDGTESVLTEDDYNATSTDFNPLKGGRYTVTISLKSDSKIFATYVVDVVATSATLKITSPAAKISYNRNDNISYDGLTISEVLDDGTEIPLSESDYVITTDYKKSLGGEYTVTIKLKSNEEIFTTYKVTVEKKISSISVQVRPTITSYELGEELDTKGLVIQKSFNDYTKEDISSSEYMVDISKYDKTKGGTYKITVSLNNSTLTTSFNVTVVKNIVSCIYDGKSTPKKTIYELNEDFDLRNDTIGLKFELTYNDGTKGEATRYAFKHETTHDKGIVGKYSVTISFNLETYPSYQPIADFTYTYEITVREPIVNGLSIAKYPEKMIYASGETLSLNGLSVEKNFSDGMAVKILDSEYNVTNAFDSSVVGEYIIKVSYKANLDIYVEFSVAVNPIVSPINFVTTISNNMEVLGSKYTFDFTAKEKNGKNISSSDVNATIDGNASIIANWSDDEKTSYTIELNNQTSEYKIVFVVTDSDNNVVLKTYTIKHPPVYKGDPIGQITFSVDAFTIGHGYIIEPTVIDMYEGENCVYSLARVIRNNGYCFTYTGTLESGFYIQRIISGKTHAISNCACKALNDTIPILNPKALLVSIDPPQNIIDMVGELEIDSYEQGSLGEFDLHYMSGWMYAVNNVLPNVGFADCFPRNGDVIRAQFTLAYGSDISDGWGGSGYFQSSNKDAITALIAKINVAHTSVKIKCAKEYNEAIALISQFDIDQSTLDEALAMLKAAYDKAVA